MRSSELKISKVKHHGVDKFQVNFGKHHGGKRRFGTEVAAKNAIKVFKSENKRLGELSGKLSASDVAQMLEAKQLLEGTGISVLEAVRLGKDELDKHQASETFGVAFDAYYNHCENEFKKKARNSDRKEPKHVCAVRQTRAKFEDLRELLLTEITPEQLEERLDRARPSLFNMRLTHLRAMFNFAKKKKWIQDNPVLQIQKESVETREGRAYRPEEVRRFMDTLVARDQESLPYYALIFFAGLRPDTAFKLDWSALNSGSQIQLKRTISKTSKAFPVTITPTLQAWLDWWGAQGMKREGRIHARRQLEVPADDS